MTNNLEMITTERTQHHLAALHLDPDLHLELNLGLEAEINHTLRTTTTMKARSEAMDLDLRREVQTNHTSTTTTTKRKARSTVPIAAALTAAKAAKAVAAMAAVAAAGTEALHQEPLTVMDHQAAAAVLVEVEARMVETAVKTAPLI